MNPYTYLIKLNQQQKILLLINDIAGQLVQASLRKEALKVLSLGVLLDQKDDINQSSMPWVLDGVERGDSIESIKGVAAHCLKWEYYPALKKIIKLLTILDELEKQGSY